MSEMVPFEEQVRTPDVRLFEEVSCRLSMTRARSRRIDESRLTVLHKDIRSGHDVFCDVTVWNAQSQTRQEREWYTNENSGLAWFWMEVESSELDQKIVSSDSERRRRWQRDRQSTITILLRSDTLQAPKWASGTPSPVARQQNNLHRMRPCKTWP
jgi:hypothetical protein